MNLELLPVELELFSLIPKPPPALPKHTDAIRKHDEWREEFWAAKRAATERGDKMDKRLDRFGILVLSQPALVTPNSLLNRLVVQRPTLVWPMIPALQLP